MRLKVREPVDYAPETMPTLPRWLKCAVCGKNAEVFDKGTSYCCECHQEVARIGKL